MTNIKALIVDDEHSSRVVLSTLLKNHCSEVEVIAEASSVNEAFTKINELQPNLVFLDIQMPTGNGFGLLEKFKEPPFDVIFVTSYNQFAINAIKFSALDYLLKPIDVESLVRSVQKATTNLERKNSQVAQIINLINNIDPTVLIKKIAIHAGEVVKYINITDIEFIQADSNYSIIHTIDGKKHSSSKTLKEFEDMLIDFPVFVRIHKSYIINVQHLSRYSKGDPFIITMNSGTELEASRRKKVAIIEQLNK